MNTDRSQLLAQAHRRACTLPAARDRELRRAIVARVLFDLRAALNIKRRETER